MPTLGPLYFSLICLALLITNAGQIVFWCWLLKRRELHWASLRSEQEAVRRLQELTFEATAKKFEAHWQKNISEKNADLATLIQIWFEECRSPRDFCAYSFSSNGILKPLKSDVPPLSLQPSGFLRISQADTRLCGPLRLESDDFKIEDSHVDFQQIWAFPLEASARKWVIVSHLPQFSYDERLTLQVLTKCLGQLTPSTTVLQESLANSDEHELRLIRDMLQLRSLTDIEFSSPEELLEEFLNRLAALAGFELATIYFRIESNHKVPQIYSRGGRSYYVDHRSEWDLQEVQLASKFEDLSVITWLSQDELQDFFNTDTLTKTALIVPLQHEQLSKGILILTTRESVMPGQVTEQLAGWAAQFLLNSFEKATTRKIIEERARRDGLTGLANRFTFDHEFSKILGGCTLNKVPCSLLVIDIDHFKNINDRYGHLTGDEALRRIAQIISQTVQSHQMVSDRPLIARYGGEEFAVVLPNCALSGAQSIADSIRVNLQNSTMHVGSHQLQMTASIGISTSPPHRESFQLLQAADDALYQAKWDGRNRTVVAPSSLEESGMHQVF